MRKHKWSKWLSLILAASTVFGTAPVTAHAANMEVLEAFSVEETEADQEEEQTGDTEENENKADEGSEEQTSDPTTEDASTEGGDTEADGSGETDGGEAVIKSMASVSIGGVNYFYVNTENDADGTVYRATITSRQGSTDYDYEKAQLTRLGETDWYYINANGTTALTGTLYGYEGGTATNYSTVYGNLGVVTDTDTAYDAVSSATGFKGFHTKDIPSLVVLETDGEGGKTITGLTLGRNSVTVDAVTYVEAGILKAAGEALTDEQTTANAVALKPNPMTAPAEEDIQPVLASASFVSESRYGTAEFDLVLDDTVAGYVWSEYWGNVYAATVSDGATTVGAVHWIDLYGEAATAGPHYNKLQVALNNGESVATNKANVNRYAAFYDENNAFKSGLYTVTVYAEGYTDLTAKIPVLTEEEQAAVDNVSALLKTANDDYATADEAEAAVRAAQEAYNALSTGLINILNDGLEGDAEAALAQAEEKAAAQRQSEEAAKQSVVTLKNKKTVYTGKAIKIGAATVTGSVGKVTYTYYSDKACTKKLDGAPVNSGTYYVKASVEADASHYGADSDAAKLVIEKAASTVTLKAKTASYTGKAINIEKAKVKGSSGKVTYTYYSDAKCTKKAASHINAGTYYVKASVAADANYKTASSKTVKLTISQAAQKITVKTTKKSFKQSALKTGKKTFGIGAASSGKGTLSYKKVKGASKLSVNKKTGEITVKKGTGKGTYTMKVEVKAASNKNYKAASKTVTITVTVK